MDKNKYLERIDFTEKVQADLHTFKKLHRNHVHHIPFENLDIHVNKKIKLDLDALFNKVVECNRGGFCYELNYLFHDLLVKLGFNAKIISARILKDGKIGPPYDHMAIIVHIDHEDWLADVGFGDLFIEPLKIDAENEQTSKLPSFKISPSDENSFLLSKSENGIDFEKKYMFDKDEKRIECFIPQCELKQQSPLSHFVINKICTIAQENGRKTLFNSKYVERTNGQKREIPIKTEEQEKNILRTKFNIVL